MNVILALLAVVVWQRALARPDGRLHVTMLEVGSGDAWLIQTPSGRNLLVDGGPSTNALSEALGRRLPFGEREIDYLVVAASGEAQLAGLPRTLERFPVRNVLWAGPPAGGYSARELQKSLALQRVPIITAQKGQALDLGEGARLEVLATGLRGAVLLVEWGRFRLLLPVGLDFESMQALMKDPQPGPGDSAAAGRGRLCPAQPGGVDRALAPAGGAAERGGGRPGRAAQSAGAGGGAGLQPAAHRPDGLGPAEHGWGAGVGGGGEAIRESQIGSESHSLIVRG